MDTFEQPFGKERQQMRDELISMPWDEKPSVYEHILSRIEPGKPGLRNGDESLPDDHRVNRVSHVRFAPGAKDGVCIHHMGGGDKTSSARRTVELVVAYCRRPTAANKAALYKQIVEGQLVSLIDPIVELLAAEGGLNRERLYDLARSFATESPDREPVKFGIAILGIFGQAENVDLFQALGRHDEFTLFCAVALSNSCEQREQALWTLARNVDGWGRIHVVERLADTENPEIKEWLLRKGFRNSIMYEYLACTCARAGGLLSALSEDRIDRELQTSAGEIIQALIAGGPAESIDDYEDGPAVVEMYLGHMKKSAQLLGDFEHVSSIREFLDDQDSDWVSRSDKGWSNERRASLKAICDAILTRPEWPSRVRDGLNSADESEFFFADRAAKVLGIDTWPVHWRRLQDKPIDSGRWYQVMALCNEERIEAVVEAAERYINLAGIATGPSNELGIGPGYEHHLCLTWVLQRLRRFPGHGSKLLEAGLKSPGLQNRNMAMAALAAWGQDSWSDVLRESLKAAAEVEPVEEIRAEMRKVLNGEPLEDP